MKHYGAGQIEEKHVSLFGADISVFSDGSVWIHRGTKNKRHFGYITQKGYRAVHVRDNGVSRTVFVHRLVAIAFIPNPQNKPQINHLNGDKSDNRPRNLEWVTAYENVRHKIDVLGDDCHRKPVRCVETETEYASLLEAARMTGISRGNISGCLSGRRLTAGGCHWVRGGESH